jgi:beta-fructofuranosidase
MYHGTRSATWSPCPSDPLLLNWEKVTGQAVIPLPKPGDAPLPYNMFDPCIWKQGEYYYALTAGTCRFPAAAIRCAPIPASLEGSGNVGIPPSVPRKRPVRPGRRRRRMPVLLADRRQAHPAALQPHERRQVPAGRLRHPRDKFVVTDGGDFNLVRSAPAGVHAPSACPDGEGGVIAIFNMNPAKPTQGWNQIMTLPRRLTLPARINWGSNRRATSSRSAASTARRTDDAAGQRGGRPGRIRGNAMEMVAEIDPRRGAHGRVECAAFPNAEETASSVSRCAPIRAGRTVWASRSGRKGKTHA